MMSMEMSLHSIKSGVSLSSSSFSASTILLLLLVALEESTHQSNAMTHPDPWTMANSSASPLRDDDDIDANAESIAINATLPTAPQNGNPDAKHLLSAMSPPLLSCCVIVAAAATATAAVAAVVVAAAAAARCHRHLRRHSCSRCCRRRCLF
jgi:hypothetical protein